MINAGLDLLLGLLAVAETSLVWEAGDHNVLIS